ncbi:MAG: DUF3347 domain-containing protein [Bacteroidota bacterium]
MQHFSIFFFIILIAAGCSSKNEGSTDVQSIHTFDNVDPSVKQQFATFLTNYFKLNEALINDSLDSAKTAAKSFAQTTKTFDVSKLSGEQLDYYYLYSSNLKLALGNLGSSPDIETARAELATISESMYALVKAFHPNDTPLYYQYCPMARDNKGANWIQRKERT